MKKMICPLLKLSLLLSAVAAALAADPAKPPNIILILADDLGWGDLGAYNRDSRVPTPHLDRLAAEGMRFTDAHSPSAVCTPTRYGILTGRYSWRTRLKSGVLWGYSPPLLEAGRLTVAELLRGQGYVTSCIGKWHLGLGWSTRAPAEFGDRQEPSADPALVDFSRRLSSGPQTAGFDHSFILPASLDMEPYVFVENGRPLGPVTARVAAGRHQRQGGRGFWREGPIGPGFTHEGCQPTLLAEAERFLRSQRKGRPFFLYFPMTSPHDPWVPLPEFRGRSGAGDRGDFVVQVDATVGRLLGVLQDCGLAGDTLVLFASDNGAHWLPEEMERTGHRANGPWRGQKSDAWEGGHRIPLLARWPGRIRPGANSAALVSLTDFIATAADLAGLTLPRDAGEDSISLLPVLLGKVKSARESLVSHSINGVFAVRKGNWKWIESKGSGGWSPGEVSEESQLYDLNADPVERVNLVSEKASLVDEMRRLLRDYQSSGRSRP